MRAAGMSVGRLVGRLVASTARAALRAALRAARRAARRGALAATAAPRVLERAECLERAALQVGAALRVRTALHVVRQAKKWRQRVLGEPPSLHFVYEEGDHIWRDEVTYQSDSPMATAWLLSCWRVAGARRVERARGRALAHAILGPSQGIASARALTRTAGFSCRACIFIFILLCILAGCFLQVNIIN